MKQTLPSIRIDSKRISNMECAIKKYNEKNLVQMTMQEFRRLSYALLSQMILQDKEIPIKLSQE